MRAGPGPLRSPKPADAPSDYPLPESIRAAGVAVGQLLVVEAEQVQDRRVPVVDMHRLLDRLIAVVVGLAVGEAALDAAAGHPGRVRLVVVVAAVVTLRERG